LGANIFEGLSTVIGSFIGNKIYNLKYKNNAPKKVKLIPAKEVNLREVKKEKKIVLIPFLVPHHTQSK